MDYKLQYEKWLNYEQMEPSLKKELVDMKDNDSEIKEHFYKELEFGTAGLRGTLGAGINNMNIYVVRRATQGIANYILSQNPSYKERGVVIAYDSRNYSPEFAMETALTLCANGIKAYLFDELRPVPELSFAVRYLKTIAGVVITASHNPKEYNGYKVYWEDGSQVPPNVSDAILSDINKADYFNTKLIDKETALKEGLLKIIGAEVDEAYINEVYKQAINKDVVKSVADKFKMIYTPLHGSGNKLVRKILDKSGFKNVLIVKEQELPDGNFSTVKSPNPENKEAFTIAIELAKKENVDLIIGTDPDCDRVGVVIKTKSGDYITLSGNQIGSLLTNYIISAKYNNNCLPKNGAVVSTIVSTPLAKKIAESYGMTYFSTLTGFKFIGEKIHEFETTNNHEFLFGFEESFGYLAGTHARDKDGVVSSMLIAEMAATYSAKNMTLYDGLVEMYEKFGGFSEETVSITLPGSDGIAKIGEIMENLRNNTPKKFGQFEVLSLKDFKIGTATDFKTGDVTELSYPKSNVLYFTLSGGVDFVVRPSGTEPKIKLYYLVNSETKAKSDEILENAKAIIGECIIK
ncbi:MAG: phospho-sugar mutase [Clostridia bacterium]|nr:phospho-sugar mutase [Clostridia bacterium]